MSRPNERSSILAVMGSLGWPLVFGLSAWGVFTALIFKGPLNTPTFHRYFTAHPVFYFESGMFFVGLAALLVKLVHVVGQYRLQGQVGLGTIPHEGQSIDECGNLLDRLEELPPAARETYLACRLRAALEHLERKGSAQGLDDELKYLADMDAARQHDSYALPRIIIWATPMLGFLGTVMGITTALGDLNPAELASSIQTAMEGLLSGLYVAFDTTAVALCLSMLLMFIQFVIDRMETQLLAVVDSRMNEELVGRFEQLGNGTDPVVASVERMCQVVARSSEGLVQGQAELWQKTIDAAHDQWSQLVNTAAEVTVRSLADALGSSLERHAQVLAESERQITERTHRHWEVRQGAWTETAQAMHHQQLELSQLWQTALLETAQTMHDQQLEMKRHTELITRAVQATGEVLKLEQALNQNLKSLAGARHFEETVMSLSAAIHLLNARLGPTNLQPIELAGSDARGRAA